MHRLTAICVRYPSATLVITLVLTALAAWSATKTRLAVGTDASLGASHNAVREFEDFLDTFGGGYPIVVGFECSDSDVCEHSLDSAALEMANAVSHRLEQASFVSRVSSPGSTRVLVADDDLGIEARQLIVDGQVVADPEIKKIALNDPLWTRTLVSDDGRVGAIVIELASTETEALSTVVEEVRQAIQPYAGRGFNFYLVGEAVMNVAAQEDGEASAARAGVATGGTLFAALLFLVRSFAAVLGILATIGVASAWTMGLLPLIGWQQSILTDGAATLILVIGCADCVHFVSRYLETRARFDNDTSALEATARWVLGPCVLTSATTVGSFVSFAGGEVLALTQFGVMAAIGISAAFVLTFSFLPALLRVMPPKPRRARHSSGWKEVLRRISNFGTRRRNLVLLASVALGLLGATGIPNLRVEMDISSLWGADHPITRAIDFVSLHLQRADRLEVGVTIPAEAELEDPSTIEVLVAVETELRSLDGVGHPQSLLGLLRGANRLLRPNAPPDALPKTGEGIAELLFFVSSGAAGALDAWVTLDQRRVRMSFEVASLSMKRKEALLTQAEKRLRSVLPAGWTYSITGSVALASRYGTEFSRSQTNIVSASTLLVFAMIGAYLRSIPWAILAMIPNAIALVLLFGAMGHWGIPLNFGSAIVAPIAIGIAADDTIHFLTAYARERRSGKDAVPALHGAISGVGEAVIATSTALALGFLSMMASPMASVADMGLLCAIAIIGATVADLLMLPALIATVAGWRRFQALPGQHG